MKKIISILMIMALSLSMVACGDKEKLPENVTYADSNYINYADFESKLIFNEREINFDMKHEDFEKLGFVSHQYIKEVSDGTCLVYSYPTVNNYEYFLNVVVRTKDQETVKIEDRDSYEIEWIYLKADKERIEKDTNSILFCEQTNILPLTYDTAMDKLTSFIDGNIGELNIRELGDLEVDYPLLEQYTYHQFAKNNEKAIMSVVLPGTEDIKIGVGLRNSDIKFK